MAEIDHRSAMGNDAPVIADASRRRRMRKIRRRRQQSLAERLRGYVPYLVVGGSYLAAIVLILRPLSWVLDRPDNGLLYMLLFAPLGLYVGAGMLLTAVVGTFLLARSALLNDTRYWQRSPCRACGSHHKNRVRRRWIHKLLGAAFGIPIRRSVCADCGYRMLDVDEHRLHG